MIISVGSNLVFNYSSVIASSQFITSDKLFFLSHNHCLSFHLKQLFPNHFIYFWNITNICFMNYRYLNQFYFIFSLRSGFSRFSLQYALTWAAFILYLNFSTNCITPLHFFQTNLNSVASLGPWIFFDIIDYFDRTFWILSELFSLQSYELLRNLTKDPKLELSKMSNQI